LAYNSGTGAFSIQVASGSQNGYLSSTNWTTFNAKIGGSGTTNYIPKFNGSGTTITNSLIYDNGTNVGIGTTSPAFKLDVEGSIVARSGVNYTRLDNNQIAAFISGTSSDLYINYSGANTLLNSTAGKVGIGTTAPYTPFHIASTDAVQRFEVIGGVTNKRIYELRAVGASGFEGFYIRTVNDANNSYNTILYLTHSGNLGIGTTSPTLGKVVSKDAGYQFIAEPTDTATFGYLGIGHFTNGTFIGTTAGTNAASNILRLGTSGAEKMRIDASGNVGIGTTSPQSLLHVNGVITFGGDTRYGVSKIYNSAVGDGFGFEQVSSAQTGLSGAATRIFTANGGSNYISLGKYTTATAFTDWLFINQSGSVGIGTTAPAASSLLDVTSTTKGFLPPRMTNTQRLAISSPAVGLIVFVTTTLEEGLWVYHSTGWVNYNLI